MPIQGLSLMGFMERRAAMFYLKQNCYLPGKPEAAMVRMWQEARQRLGGPQGRPGRPDIADLPATADAYLAEIKAHAHFAEACGSMRSEFKLVEIAPLLAYQFHVIDNAADICDPAEGPPGLDATLKICLPLGEEISTIQSAAPMPAGNVVEIRSPDMNSRVYQYVPGTDPAGRPVFGISIAPRVAHVQVVRFEGRCYLKNGYHRARALACAGATHMPSIVLDATSFQQVGAVSGGTFDHDLLRRSNAPTCSHFADGRAYALPIRRHGQVIRLQHSIAAEVLE